MRVVLLYNPRSGRGRTTHHVTALRHGLTTAGIDVGAVAVDASLTTSGLAHAAKDAAALIIAGGDGSVHHALPAALEAAVPVYQYPLGTENLFAREFRFSRSIDDLVAALARRRIVESDVATCNGRAFVLMASVGFDAHVVERVAARRESGVRRTDYLRHALAEFSDLRLAPLTVSVDGQSVAEDESGLVIVANSPQYAARLNPCATARVDDGRLDVLFLPYRTPGRLAAWATSIALGMHLQATDARSASGAKVSIRSAASHVPHQLDGESVPGSRATLSLEIGLHARRLRVLLAGD
jgi:diacylglycerol kinase family enzyme